MLPWTDRTGKISALKLAVFIGCFVPAVLLAQAAVTDALGAKPVMAAIHDSGDWAIRFLLLSLAITPLRRIAHWSRLILVRRMVGLAALAYGLLHLVLYAAEMAWDIPRVVSEIVLRIYLTIGFVALFGLILLGLTSTDAAIRKLGKRWGLLHKAVYPIAVLSAVHFFLQSKIDVTEATLMAGFLFLLFSYRLANRWNFRLDSPLVLLALAALGGLGTAAIEYAWYALATGVPPLRVLAANLEFGFTIRPAWWVAFTGLAVALLSLPRLAVERWRLREKQGGKPAPALGGDARLG